MSHDQNEAETGLTPVLDSLIVGAGAAGVFAACRLKALAPKQHIALIEATGKPLSKVHISGGGRCNVTHNSPSVNHTLAHYPRGGRFLKGPGYAFTTSAMVQWLEERGVTLKTEADGRMFPVTDCSDTIVQCLLTELARQGTRITLNTRLVGLQPIATPENPESPNSWQAFLAGPQGLYTLHSKQVLLACGASGAIGQCLAKLGQPMVPTVPSLFTFTVDAPWLVALSGISVADVTVSLPAFNKQLKPQTGPVLITHWGLSGPAVLKLSAWGARLLHEAGYKSIVQVDWLGPFSLAAVTDRLAEYKQAYPVRQLHTHSPFAELPKALWQALCTYVGIADTQQWAHLNKQQGHRLCQALKQCTLPLVAKGTFKEEFVQAGGVALSDVNPKSMASRVLPGLYFAGELLDVDGLTGGFNFQHAWSSAWVAASAMAHHNWE